MTDIRQELVARYAAAGRQGQVEFLAWLADRLTVHARDTYNGDGGVADSTRLRAFNEAQHRVNGQLFAMVTGNERRYPDAVFGHILADQCAMLKIDPSEIVERMPNRAGERAAE